MLNIIIYAMILTLSKQLIRTIGLQMHNCGISPLVDSKRAFGTKQSWQLGKNYSIIGYVVVKLTRQSCYSYRSQQKFIDFRKDYYEILGVAEDASLQQIKQKFYLLAKEYHPDRNKGADSKFKEINEAYNVLSQSHLRKDYDSNRFKSDEEEGEDNTLKDQKAGKGSLNYGAYSQMSRAGWAVYRSGFMRHNPVDYSNFQKRYSLQSDNDLQLKKKKQWNDAFRTLTVQQVKEQMEFREKLYKKYVEDMQTQAKARQAHLQQKLNLIGDKIQRVFGSTIRGVYDRMIKK